MKQLCDVAILGATAAGFAAAHYLARKGCQATVVESPPENTECPLADWVPGDFFRLPNLVRNLARECRAAPFSRVCYHNLALDKEVEYRARGAAGYFLPAGAVLGALRQAAGRAGARVRSTATRPAIRLEEDGVQLLGSTQVRAKLLLIAHSRPNEVLSELAMPARGLPDSPLVVAGLDVPLGARAGTKGCEPCPALHVVELPERNELGLFFVANGLLHLRLVSNSLAGGTRAAELSGMVSRLQRAGILPGELALDRAKGAVWRPPAGVALELETHVAKRCLLIGTAGGFAESIMGQSLAPSARSALIACDVILDALKSPQPQAVLMSYKTLWRGSLADSLRPPNTSLQMLLPLLFVNRRIVAKFTRALLYGESI